VKVLAVASDKLEAVPWLKQLGLSEKQPWPLPYAHKTQWGSDTLYAVAAGEGPRCAERALDTAVGQAGPFSALMSIGLCGALNPSFSLNQLCTATEVGDGNTTWPAQTVPGATKIRLLSIDRFLGDPAEKEQWAEKGFDAVDMEAAAIARYAAAHRLPFSAVKVVSDCAHESFALDFNQYRGPGGAFLRGKIAMAAATRPWKYAPGLIRMATRAFPASETLGVFLAKSRL